ncbi:MAG: hypothetical protein MAG453_02023 [Calditrichaeota bacterium]|nr:hypothetical protein [Calditrichota bacterium]
MCCARPARVQGAGKHSGHFESNSVYPIAGRTGSPQIVNLGAVFDFDADAVGDGACTIGGEEFIRFTFEGVTTGDFGDEITGFYTLKNENWETEHPFSFGV